MNVFHTDAGIISIKYKQDFIEKSSNCLSYNV